MIHRCALVTALVAQVACASAVRPNDADVSERSTDAASDLVSLDVEIPRTDVPWDYGVDASDDFPSADHPDIDVRTDAGPICQRPITEAGVAIPAPRPIAPLSPFRLSSRRPTLRWALASGVRGACVDVCARRSCDTPMMTLEAIGDRVRTPTELPPGPIFWRLRGIAGEDVGSATSRVWQFHVRARSSPNESSLGPIVDVNGDGYADVIGSTAVPRTITVSHGGPSGPPAAAYVDVPETNSQIVSAGDMNGDGFGELVIGDARLRNVQRPYVWRGTPRGLVDPMYWPLEGENVESYVTSAVGDMDGDGYADLVIGQPGTLRRVQTYFGSPTGPIAGVAISAPMTEQGEWASSIAGVGDVNGDGRGDFLVGYQGQGAMDTAAPVALYLGSAALRTGPPPVPDALLMPPPDALRFGTRIWNAGDVNGDGLTDALISGFTRSDGFVELRLGSSSGLAASRVRLVAPDDRWVFPMGYDASAAHDVNGDGFDDVLIPLEVRTDSGAPLARIQLYLGNERGLDPPTAILAANIYVSDASCHGVGDINGDGFDDIVFKFAGPFGAVPNIGRMYWLAGTPGVIGPRMDLGASCYDFAH